MVFTVLTLSQLGKREGLAPPRGPRLGRRCTRRTGLKAGLASPSIGGVFMRESGGLGARVDDKLVIFPWVSRSHPVHRVCSVLTTGLNPMNTRKSDLSSERSEYATERTARPGKTRDEVKRELQALGGGQ